MRRFLLDKLFQWLWLLFCNPWLEIMSVLALLLKLIRLIIILLLELMVFDVFLLLTSIVFKVSSSLVLSNTIIVSIALTLDRLILHQVWSLLSLISVCKSLLTKFLLKIFVTKMTKVVRLFDKKPSLWTFLVIHSLNVCGVHIQL